MPFLHIAKGHPSCLPSSSPVVNFQPIGANFQQKVAKVNFSLVCFGVFSGFSETKKGKSEIYFGFGAFVVLLSSSFVVAVVVSTCGRWWCPPSAGGWLLCACGVRRFRGLWRVCLYFVLFCPLSCPLFCPLSCPFALVFAFLFVLFAPAFISFPAFLGLSSWLLGFCSWSCPLSLWVVVSFSLTVYTQKERAQFLASSLGVLFSRSNSCNVVKKLRCRCFGFFQFVRFILPTNTIGVGRLAGSHLNPFRHNVNITDNPPAFLK